jgi:glycosyltransferase involved in cell wall biosynthesis
MRVLIIGINYRPELSGIGPYTADLAEHLAGRGDDVTVIAGLPHYPSWRIGRETPRRLIGEERIGGVRVVRAAHFVPARQDAIRRAAYEATFGLTGLLASRSVTRAEAILGVVPSLSGGILARLLSGRSSTPYGLLFQDLMGPAANQSGMPGGGLVAGATATAERWAVGRASAVGVVATSFVPYVRTLGVPATRVVHVPNWSRLAESELSVDAVRERFGWTDGRQVVLHAGNIGLKQGLEQVVDAARLATERGDPIRFVLSGGGSQEAAIRVSAADLENVQFVGLQPEGVHASLLAAADVLLLSERSTQVDMSLPSKLTSYYSAGRPIVAAVGLGGATAEDVQRSNAGIVVPAGQPASLLDAVLRLRGESGLADMLAAAGPAYARSHASAEACLARGAAFVDLIASKPSSIDIELKGAA